MYTCLPLNISEYVPVTYNGSIELFRRQAKQNSFAPDQLVEISDGALQSSYLD